MIRILLFVCVSFINIHCNANEITFNALGFIDKIIAKDYHGSVGFIDEGYREKMNAKILEQIWESILSKKGECSGRLLNCVKDDEVKSVFITLMFKKDEFDSQIQLNDDLMVIGWRFVPKDKYCSNENQFSTPKYDKTIYKENEFSFKSGTEKLFGTVIKPDRPQPITCFFVHGSGAIDRNGTIGRNKMFKDLAVGLANFGISSYRYDKRTFTYPKMDSSITIDKEVTHDIKELIKFIKGNEKEGTKIFLIGHSLGGMLAPRIWGNCQNDLDGLIMMASNARPFEELLLYQFNYLASIDGIVDSAENNAIKQLNQQIENLNDGKLENLPFGQPYKYWKSLKEYDQILAAKKVNVPMLIIQGARDYQVPIDDFEIWQHELENKEQVTFKLFKKLDHLFLAGKGRSTPQDYMNESKNIPYYVIKTMAKWMKKH